MWALKSIMQLLMASATVVLAAMANATVSNPRCVMYLTGQHDVIPSRELAAPITHVILAFLRSEVFVADEPPTEYPLFNTVDRVRKSFESDTKVTVAIGGWGDWEGFQTAAKTPESRKKWSEQVKIMVDRTGADGIDIDWEYPGGNRDDYKEIPNSEREWEIEAFVELLQELRSTLGTEKLLTIATPGKEVDLMAFTASTIPRIVQTVDFINVMTYDLMNRRDTTVVHHSGVASSSESIERYIERGAPANQLNVGLGYYVKWFLTQDRCDPARPVGCPTQLLEDPATGADLGRTGGFSWHDETPADVAGSFSRAQTLGVYDDDGSYGYWDSDELRWWSFDTPQVVQTKMRTLVDDMKLGGVFAWGLGEDAPEFEHLKATIQGLKSIKRAAKDEL